MVAVLWLSKEDIQQLQVSDFDVPLVGLQRGANSRLEPLKLQVNEPQKLAPSAGSAEKAMWHSRPVSPCPSCGRPTAA